MPRRPEGVITDWYPGAEHIFGFTAETWSACTTARSMAAATRAACSPCACRCTPLLSPSFVGLYHLPMHLNRHAVEVLEHFRNAAAIKTLPAGMTLFKAGDPADFVYILVDGQANLLVGKTVVEVAVRGHLLGEVGLIDGKPRSATVMTRTQCQVLPIDAAQFAALVRDLPGFSDYVMNAMAERMRRMNDNLRAAQTVEGVNARLTTNTSLSMEEDATLPPPPPKRADG